MDGSVNMACMGEACEDLGYNFFWPAWSQKTHFWKEGAVEEVPLVVHSRAPFLLSCIRFFFLDRHGNVHGQCV